MKNKEVNTELEPEYLFGISLYNYFREWVPENKKILKAFLTTFPKGDKKLAIEQLEQVSTEAFYTRIEAMRYLTNIYARYENEYYKAWKYIKKLHENYPNNPYFARTYVIIAYHTGRQAECIKACKMALQKVEKNNTGYENETGRICSFMLGHFYDAEKNYNKAEYYYTECLKYTELPNAYSTIYTINGLEKCAKYALTRNDSQTAYFYYYKIKSLSNNKKGETYKEAKKFLKKNKKEFKQ